jgi:hypothetical protein
MMKKTLCLSALLLAALGCDVQIVPEAPLELPASSTEGCTMTPEIPEATSQPRPGAQKLLPSPVGAYPGLFTFSPRSEYDDYVRVTGHAPKITFAFYDWWYGSWDDPDPELLTFTDVPPEQELSALQMAEKVADDGGILAITWNTINYIGAESLGYYVNPEGRLLPVSFDEILAGEHDGYLRAVAAEVKAFGRPLMIAPFAEQNSVGYFSFGPDATTSLEEIAETGESLCDAYGDPAAPDGPERLRDVTRYIIDLFRAEEVENVTWFQYAATGYMSDDPRHGQTPWLGPATFYPGDDYIDWVGASGYHGDPEHGYDNATDILGPAVDAFAAVTDRPFITPEFGVQTAGDRVAQTERTFLDELPALDNVRAFTTCHGLLCETLFGLPRIGALGDDDRDAYVSAVYDSGLYAEELVFTEDGDG